MFATLMESRSMKVRNELGTAASAAIHLTLIVVAAYVTTASARTPQPDDPPTQLHWVTPRPSQPSTGQSPSRAPASSSTASTTRTIRNISLSISADIPDVNIPLGGVRTDDFAASPIGTSTSNATSTGAAGDKPAFEAYEVDSPVSAIAGSYRPEYPAALRSAGIEGDVTAQFIVDRYGHASAESIRILTSTNELFAASVKRAIPRMRFVAARLNGEPVAQSVQQLFSFRLDH